MFRRFLFIILTNLLLNNSFILFHLFVLLLLFRLVRRVNQQLRRLLTPTFGLDSVLLLHTPTLGSTLNGFAQRRRGGMDPLVRGGDKRSLKRGAHLFWFGLQTQEDLDLLGANASLAAVCRPDD